MRKPVKQVVVNHGRTHVQCHFVLVPKVLDCPDVVARPRFHHGGAPDVTFHEDGVPAPVLEGLEARGHLLRTAPGLGRVNAVYCPDSFKRRQENCQFANDPRGWGLGVIVQ